MLLCPDYETVNKEQVQIKKRLYSVKVLFFKILLYRAGPESVIKDRLLNKLF
jgi:hypothetical protein